MLLGIGIRIKIGLQLILKHKAWKSIKTKGMKVFPQLTGFLCHMQFYSISLGIWDYKEFNLIPMIRKQTFTKINDYQIQK